MTSVENRDSNGGHDTVDGPVVLMVAYTCSPYRGSEPGVGWHRALEMAKYFQVHVITEEIEFKNDIEEYLSAGGQVPNLSFHFVPRVFKRDSVWKMMYPIRPLYYLAYAEWHRRAYRLALRIQQTEEFDLVHQSTMCGFREPGQLWRLPVPFIWGPIGGTQHYPSRFLLQAGLKGAVKEGFRSLVNRIQLRFSRRVRKAAKAADAVLTAIPDGKRCFKDVFGVDAICMLDVGVGNAVGRPRTFSDRTRPLRLLWSGVLEHHKALQLLIRALAKLPPGLEFKLKILGDGPRRHAWQDLARRSGVDEHCSWTGWIAHDLAMREYGWADVFVFTSLRDTCGTVVLEALSRGLPVICLDHQGAGVVVTDRCGMKVPVTSPSAVIEGLRDSVVVAAENPELLTVLSKGAVQRAREFLWCEHGTRLANIYRGVLDSRRPGDEVEGSSPRVG